MRNRVIHVSAAEAESDFPSLLKRVRAGAEVVIQRHAEAVAVIRPAAPEVRLLSESPSTEPVSLLSISESPGRRRVKQRGSNATLDANFGRDLEAVVGSHREPLIPPVRD
jgi:antitoxin (DNA-binding transcriptional repressor) of toxin-antitoxin stability system